MPELLDATPAVVLAIYAHPDDAEVACAGTLARWSTAGSEIHLVICTDGAKGTSDPMLEPVVLAEQRVSEVAAAAAIVGLKTHYNLGLADGEVENTVELRAEFVSWIRRLRPDVVLGHDPTAVFFAQHYFNHRDHREVGWALLDALSPAAALPHYFPECGPPHQVQTAYLSGSLEPDVWVDVTDTIGTKVAAVACHRSQLPQAVGSAHDVVRIRAAEEGARAGVAFAEGFRRLLVSS